LSKTRPATEEDLKDLIDYFFTLNGKLYAKKRYCHRVQLGQEVGWDNGNGRLTVMCKGKLYQVHRVIYYLHNGYWPRGVVDHMNGNPKDNRPENLRDVTQAINTRSYGPAHFDSSSSYRGVHWFKRDSKWQSQIMSEGKKKHLGYFDSESEAALRWNYEAERLGFNEEAFNNVF